MTQDESTRSNQLYIAKEALRIRRDKVARRQATDISDGVVAIADSGSGSGRSEGGAGDNDTDMDMDSDSPGSGSGSDSERIMEQFKRVLNDNAEDLDFFSKIQRLLGKKCDIAEHEVSLMKNESDVIKRRIRGYENYLGKDHGHGHGNGVAMPMQE